MGYLVLVAAVVQAAFGVSLLMSWARYARGQDAGLVVTHVVAMLLFFAPLTLFVVTEQPWWAWASLGVLAVFIGFGDAEVFRRLRRQYGGTDSGVRDYFRIMTAVCAGRHGRRLQVHTIFSAFVFFPVLAVAVGATVAA